MLMEFGHSTYMKWCWYHLIQIIINEPYETYDFKTYHLGINEILFIN